jgi:acyl carrier protein
MAQCHLAFLQAAEQSAVALASFATGAPIPALEQRPTQWIAPKAPPRRQVAPTAPLASLSQAVVAPAAAVIPSSAKRLDAPVPRATVVVRSHDSEIATSTPASIPRTNGTSAAKAAAVAVVPPPVVRPAAPTPAPPVDTRPKSNGGLVLPADGDLKSFLFGIVSDKTGYPVDILNLDQQLEADLGIDSIKRVEILSAFEGQIQNIQDINLEEVAKLNTLRDVLGFMERYADKLGLEKKK